LAKLGFPRSPNGTWRSILPGHRESKDFLAYCEAAWRKYHRQLVELWAREGFTGKSAAEARWGRPRS
jgi:hypothetical protein